MKLKIVLAITGLVWLCVSNVLAQSYAEEALIISRMRPGGSARIQGMGGVQNALGGDVSSAYYNPAGLGMYNRSDFSFTPGYSMFNSATSYLGDDETQNKTNLMIPNLGIAFHTGKDGTKGLWGGTFAINFNRINDFNNTFSYSGTNSSNSIIDYFIQDANGTNTSQFDTDGFNYNTPTGLAYFNYLIGPATVLDPNNPDDEYFTDVSGIPIQTETVKTTGSQNQWSFSYGVNFNDKIFLGGGVGIASFRYKSEKSYTESFPDAGQHMSKMVLDETLSLSGSGVNLTLGTIIRPVDLVQFGLSIATPTSYQITDNYSASMTSKWDGFDYTPGSTPPTILTNESASTDIVTSNYNLATPWRISGGVTFFFEKKGFISADAEWLNYSSTKYSSNTTGVSYSGDNDEIKGLYKSTLNLRFGAEYRVNNFRFRGGYSLMPDPFQTEQNGIDRALTSYSGGLGYRVSTFYLDLAVVMGQGNSSYRPYPGSPMVNLNSKATTVMVTVGFPF